MMNKERKRDSCIQGAGMTCASGAHVSTSWRGWKLQNVLWKVSKTWDSVWIIVTKHEAHVSQAWKLKSKMWNCAVQKTWMDGIVYSEPQRMQK
jgi:hypothetical protein